MRLALGAAALTAALLLTAFTASANRAQAAIPFCLPGTGPGQCQSPTGVAIHNASGTVYVADSGNDRVQVFEADGTFSGELGLQGPGTAAGEFDNPTQIAVDQASGDVYVVDFGNFRIQKFSSAGAFQWMIGGGVNTGTSGKANLCTNAGPPTDVCGKGANGAGEGEFSVKVGSPILVGVGPAGVLYAVDSIFTNGSSSAGGYSWRVQRFEPSGEQITQCIAGEGMGKARSLAVLAAGSFWLGSEGQGRAVRKFDPTCGLEAEIPETKAGSGSPFNSFTALASDHTDNLYSVQREVGPFETYRVIAKYDEAGETLARFGYEQLIEQPNGLAHHEGALYVLDGAAGVKRLEAPAEPPPPAVPPSSVKAEPISSVWATLSAEVNPEGQPTEYSVEFVEKAVCEKDEEDLGPGHCFDQAVGGEEVELGAEDFALHAAQITAGCRPFSEEALEAGQCLKPATAYVVRVVAENPGGEDEALAEFETGPPLALLATYAASVGSDAATVGASVNPLGSAATAYFQYVDEATFQQSGFGEASRAPAASGVPVGFGSGEAPVSRTATLYPLAEGVSYRYRVVVSNPFFADVAGPTRILRTFAKASAESCANDALRPGAAGLLPDCRGYEQVSPEEKGGSDIKVLAGRVTGLPAVVEQSSSSGEKLAYGSQQAFAEAESAPYTSQYIAQRGAGGWSTHAINPPREQVIRTGVASWDTEYKLFSEDLCTGWLRPYATPQLDPAAGPAPAALNLYRRTDELCGARSYAALIPGLDPPGLGAASEFEVELQGVSADQSKTVYRANDAIAAGGAEGVEQLYGYSEETGVRFMCVLPEGGPVSGPCTAGAEVGGLFLPRKGNATNALSTDGSRLYFTAGLATAPIYLRRNPFEPESAHLHGEAEGTGDLAGPVKASANLLKTKSIKNVKPASGGQFVVGQLLEGEGLAPETRIVAIEETAEGVFELTVDKATAAFKVGALISGVASEVVMRARADSGAFAPGQEIAAAGGALPEGTTILAVAEEAPGLYELTLSAKASKGVAGEALNSSSECTEADKACTVRVSKAAEEESGTVGKGSRYLGAATDGSRAFFLTGSTLFNNPLFEYRAADGEAELIAGEAQGILGASEDGTRLYFLSREEIGGEGEAGKPNLYLRETGEGGPFTSFVATLGEEDLETAATAEPGFHSSRVSPDGAHAAFMSADPALAAAVAGAEITDRGSELPCEPGGSPEAICDAQVYLYDAGEEELVCASCNASGARPLGSEPPIGLRGYERVAGAMPTFASSFHAPGTLSDDGARLYFESSDRLVARDTNGKVDVYQWERAGRGSCDVTDYSHNPAAGGCVELISDGQSLADSRFVDASPSGDDVFFATLSSLRGTDAGLVDIYDARVGGGFPEPPPPPAECEGEACQSPPPAPSQPTPASTTYTGPGNLAAAPGAPARCNRTARRAKRLARRAQALRKGARRAKAPALKRRRSAAARRSAQGARKLTRNAKRCRARARAARRPRR
jgi:DNA-binding beta-propeller fold protein YncE